VAELSITLGALRDGTCVLITSLLENPLAGFRLEDFLARWRIFGLKPTQFEKKRKASVILLFCRLNVCQLLIGSDAIVPMAMKRPKASLRKSKEQNRINA
jgi:hypothetical protein